MQNFIEDLEKKIDTLYDEEEICSDDEIKNIIDLVKLDDNTDFYRTFENQLSNLINSDDNNSYFEFLNQSGLKILDYILFYINKEGIQITNLKKKKKV